jgi:iron-sulfur cluster insertion protein
VALRSQVPALWSAETGRTSVHRLFSGAAQPERVGGCTPGAHPGPTLAGGECRAYLEAMAQPSSVAITPSAAARVAAIAARQGKPAVLRLSVEGGGCAGFSYRFGLAEGEEEGDLSASLEGVTLLVDEMTHDLVKGGAVDYVESLGGASFQVRNPNAASGCGCGSSFSI